MIYPSIYRAKATQVSGNKITAFVPQVFGETPIMITDFLGPPTLRDGLGVLPGRQP